LVHAAEADIRLASGRMESINLCGLRDDSSSAHDIPITWSFSL